MIYFIAKNNITIKTRNNTEHKTLGGAHLILSDYSLLRTMSVRHLHWKNGTEDRYTWCVQIHTLATGGKSGAKKHSYRYIYIYMWKYILTIMSVCTCMFLCILVYLLWTNIKMIEFNELFLTVWQLSITQMVLSFQSCSLVSPSTSNDSYHLLI